MSSASPSSASNSSVAGWVVAARGSVCGPGLLSNKRTRRPRRPSSQAHNNPTGPPPAMSTWALSAFMPEASWPFCALARIAKLGQPSIQDTLNYNPAAAGIQRANMRARLALVFAIALIAVAANGSSQAEDWPSRAIRTIIPLSPGSAADVVPRIVFDQLSAQLGQPIMVENKPGASGSIAARFVASADADGYTLLAHSSAHVISPSTVANLSYDPVSY